MTQAQQIAQGLLQVEAVKLNLTQAFTWASGWKSPIYCDNRKTLSYPDLRKNITDAFSLLIQKQYPQATHIAGIATGAIAHGVLVADRLNLPFVYVRSAAKGHGLTNLIEGDLPREAKVVVIEDLISTGGSSIAAVEALRAAGAEVLCLMAIFSYGFTQAENNFKQANCNWCTLSNYTELIEQAVKMNYISAEVLGQLENWRKNPSEYR